MPCSTAVSVTLRGATDVVLTLDGPVDPATIGRSLDLLGAALAIGARHVIVDLSAAVDVPDELLDALVVRSWELAERDGWLLIEGAEDPDPISALQNALRAYRDALPAV